MSRLLVTGSRYWDDRPALRDALVRVGRGLREADPGSMTLVIGDCPTGVDDMAVTLWRFWRRGLPHLFGEPDVHVADWRVHGKAAGPYRNARMVASGADVCLALPIGPSPGTRDCMRQAHDAGIPIVVVEQPVEART